MGINFYSFKSLRLVVTYITYQKLVNKFIIKGYYPIQANMIPF
ncbi:hypothetical protein JN11_04108 [Mucilaginibacter frigoritolerans]|uniref:Uncharacterized protein n=1 Tax=Mucilaginibacter frigoritolerans TaxID=652788 RepID=A0A562TT55_9SPHI|nr:hypothetical protein JN11_04108 [Mucilaginibacter frigoritolerans]